MKLQKIEIRNFRGFPGPQNYVFDLKGKNLLLYGENGSGKSTLFHAISEFFDIYRQNKTFNILSNIFSTDADGHIVVHFDDNQPPAEWKRLVGRPSTDARVAQTALRTSCLDYRSILRTSYIHTGNEVNLFDLLINYILNRFPVTVPGGGTSSLGAVWQSTLNAVPGRNTKSKLAQIDQYCDQFNAILELEIPRLERESEAILGYFTDCNLILHLKPERVIYNPATRMIDNQKIILEVDFNGIPTPAHQYFLNEARLSAIALALYLASIKMSVPIDLPGTPPSLKLLVLDDVVIGLDLSNRLPLLDILYKEFSDWQIVLMTYDRVWFDMVHERNPDWKIEELFVDISTYPVKRDVPNYLQKANVHFQNHDYNAAAVYIRAEFERRLKNICQTKKVPIKYRKRMEELNKSENLLDGLEEYLKNDPNWTSVYEPMINRLRAARKVVMNPLSHSQLISLAHNEIQDAIDAVTNLNIP